jgi:hypothetical protein
MRVGDGKLDKGRASSRSAYVGIADPVPITRWIGRTERGENSEYSKARQKNGLGDRKDMLRIDGDVHLLPTRQRVCVSDPALVRYLHAVGNIAGLAVYCTAPQPAPMIIFTLRRRDRVESRK